MDENTGLIWLPLTIALIIVLIISRFFILPAVCQVIPLELPGSGLDFCVLFR